MKTPLLQVDDLHKSFGRHKVLAGVGIEVFPSQVFSVLGPSGAGKSVFLKCVAGILSPESGVISFDGKTLNTPALVANFRNRCSFLFQNNALIDSLTAMENVALPLEQTTALSGREIATRCREALRQLEIDEFADRYPSQMSGGMQKRLALARAIVTRPELVFFDEPTAGLDPLRRNAVFAMIATYQRQLGFTALIVTHDVPEALAASDRVALLEKGTICFSGTPPEFRTSDHPMVRDFRDSESALVRSLASIRSAPLT